MFAFNKLNLWAYFWVTSQTRSILSMPLYFLDDIVLVWRNFYLRYQTSAHVHVQEFSEDTFSLFFFYALVCPQSVLCHAIHCAMSSYGTRKRVREREENKDDFQLFHFNGSTEWQDRNQFTLNQQEITGWFSDLLTFHISLFYHNNGWEIDVEWEISERW